MHEFWPKYKIIWVNMMDFINTGTQNWFEKNLNLKRLIFLKLFCPVGAATLRKKLVLCFIFFCIEPNFRHFSIAHDKTLNIRMSKVTYLFIFLIILARITANIKVQKYPWKSTNTNWNRKRRKCFLSWLLHKFWSNKRSFPEFES